MFISEADLNNISCEHNFSITLNSWLAFLTNYIKLTKWEIQKHFGNKSFVLYSRYNELGLFWWQGHWKIPTVFMACVPLVFASDKTSAHLHGCFCDSNIFPRHLSFANVHHSVLLLLLITSHSNAQNEWYKHRITTEMGKHLVSESLCV